MPDLFPAAPKQVSLRRQIEAADRELYMRQKTYPRRVAQGHMTRAKADDEIAVMRAIGDTLRDMQQLKLESERYRWLRKRDLDTISEGGVFVGLTPQNTVLNGEDLDRAIDQARSVEGKR